MENINATVKGDVLTLSVKLDPKLASVSSTGKTKLLATTRGAMPVSCAIPGLKVALNVMIPTTA